MAPESGALVETVVLIVSEPPAGTLAGPAETLSMETFIWVGVLVAGTGVFDGGTGVFVAGAGVLVAAAGVLVGLGVFVAGIGVFVAVRAVELGLTLGVGDACAPVDTTRSMFESTSG